MSDKQITRESGLLELVEAAYNVMVHQGFDIAGIVPDGVAVNMPPFLAGQEQMTTAETRNNKHHFCSDSWWAGYWKNKNIPYPRWNPAKY